MNPIPVSNTNVPINKNGTVGFVGEVLNVVDVAPQYLEVVAEGMRRVNTVENNGTGTSFLFRTNEDGEFEADWLEDNGLQTAGKTGTAEFCDKLSQNKGWCTEEKILNGEILPTHSWYVGYAPFENPEIVVAAFIYYGGEGSQWSAPIVRDIIAAYYGVDQYEGNPILPVDLIPESVKINQDQDSIEVNDP